MAAPLRALASIRGIRGAGVVYRRAAIVRNVAMAATANASHLSFLFAGVSKRDMVRQSLHGVREFLTATSRRLRDDRS